MEDKEILRRILQGFKLIPAKFPLTYTTTAGKATPDFAKRINAWIQTNFPNSLIRVAYDATHGILKFYRRMHEHLVIERIVRTKLKELLEALPSEKTRTAKDRIVYAYTFPEQNLAYIGLTGNEKKRAGQHKSLKAQQTTAVSRYIRETGATPEYQIVSKTEDNPSGWVDEDTAAQLECMNMEKYKKEGWQLLNLAPCGSKGGSVFDEKALLTSIDNFIASTNTSLDTLNLLPGSDYTPNAIENYNLRDAVFNKIDRIVKANGITSNKQLRKNTNRRVTSLIERWSALHPEDNWQEKLFPETTSGREKPGEGIYAFLAEPNNLNKDQLNLITKRAWEKMQPEQEKAFLDKTKKIIDRHRLSYQSRTPEKKIPSGLYTSILNHDKQNPDNKWKDVLFPKQTSKEV
jgi:hypothetical protein